MVRVLPLVISLFLASCQTGQVVQPGLDLSNARAIAELFLEKQQKREGGIYGLEGISRVIFQNKVDRFSSKQVIVAERPARLRLESLGFFNQRVSIFTTDGENYSYFQKGLAKVERGRVYSSVLLDKMGIPISTTEAVALLLGVPPLSPGTLNFNSKQKGERLLVLLFSPDGSKDTLVFDLEGKLLSFKRYSLSGRSSMEISYGNFRPVEHFGYFAYEVSFFFPELDVRATVAFQELGLNSKISRKTFMISPLGKSAH